MGDTSDLRGRLFAATNYVRPISFGVAGVFALVCIFGAWAATAPIEGAAIAPGAFIARGQNKRIQHLEGGIVAEINVAEGDTVQVGDVIVRLDATKSASELQRLTSECDTALAREARLIAERDSLDSITYPEELISRSAQDQAVAVLMHDHDREFAAGRLRRQNEISILRQKIKAQEAEILGYKAQREFTAVQLSLLDKEISIVEQLVDQGLLTQERLFSGKRKQAELRGSDGELSASIGRTEQGILENLQQIERTQNETIEKAASDLVELRVEKSKLIMDIVATRDVLTRTAVRAPANGVIVKLEVNTIGEVLSAGGAVADLLPLPADLVVEARVRPADIDRVHVGQRAAIRIPALHIPYSPLIDAKVEYVSADKFVDDDSGEAYYLTRISDIVLPSDIEARRLYAGMQIESFIVTEPRTFSEYILDPLWQAFSRSLREQ